jgi:peroxiredoxin
MIKLGQKLPNTEVLLVTDSKVQTINLRKKLLGRLVAIFGMPGAFTDTCTELHLPNIMQHKEKLLSMGVEEICLLTVNDSFVLRTWGKSAGIFKEGLTLLGDSGSEFTKAVGLNFTVPPIGFHDRSLRYAMLAENGVVKIFLVEETQSKITTSGADSLISAMSQS